MTAIDDIDVDDAFNVMQNYAPITNLRLGVEGPSGAWKPTAHRWFGSGILEHLPLKSWVLLYGKEHGPAQVVEGEQLNWPLHGFSMTFAEVHQHIAILYIPEPESPAAVVGEALTLDQLRRLPVASIVRDGCNQAYQLWEDEEGKASWREAGRDVTFGPASLWHDTRNDLTLVWQP